MFTNNLKVGQDYKLVEKRIACFLKAGDVFTIVSTADGAIRIKDKKNGGGTFIDKVDINYYRFEEVRGV